MFSPRSNAFLALALIALLGLAVGVPSALMLAPRTPYVTGEHEPVEQPIDFDHRHHVGDDGIDCRYCHDLAEVSTTAGLPPTERCLNCHSQIWSRSEKLAPLWESYRSGRPIVWRRVHRLPDFVYFNHSAHLGAGVGCITCHGRVDRMARIYQVQPLSMEWCVGCHRDPGPQLRSRALLTSMRTVPELPDAQRSTARAGTDCSTCHR